MIATAPPDHILIVDASHAMRRVLRAILAHLGHERVIEATNGPDALARVEADSIGLVIADWNMSKLDIGDFVRYLRMLRNDPPIPLLLVASVAAGPYVMRSLPDDRALDCIVKPFTVGTIEDKVVALLAKAGAPTPR